MDASHRLLFVCYGNICRSPMAEAVMRHLVRAAGREREFAIDSAGVAGFEDPAPPHPKTRRVLRRHGIDVGDHRRRALRPSDYDEWDLILYMDDLNLQLLGEVFPDDPEGKLQPLLGFAPSSYAKGRVEIADPWFTGDYDAAFDDILSSCEGLLAALD